MRFASATVPPCNVIGKGHSASNNDFALTQESGRPFLEHRQITKHFRHICIL